MVFNWSMQIMLGGIFPAKRHDGTPLDKFRAKVSKLPLHFTAVLLQATVDWQFLQCVAGFLPAWNSVQLCQGQPTWEEMLFTIVHNLHHGGQLDTWLVDFVRI